MLLRRHLHLLAASCQLLRKLHELFLLRHVEASQLWLLLGELNNLAQDLLELVDRVHYLVIWLLLDVLPKLLGIYFIFPLALSIILVLRFLKLLLQFLLTHQKLLEELLSDLLELLQGYLLENDWKQIVWVELDDLQELFDHSDPFEEDLHRPCLISVHWQPCTDHCIGFWRVFGTSKGLSLCLFIFVCQVRLCLFLPCFGIFLAANSLVRFTLIFL